MPNCLVIGVPYDLFWSLNPRTLNAFKEAYRLRIKDNNMMLYIQGQYFMCALSATVGNMFKKKGQKPNEYPDEPLDILGEKKIIVHENMTEDEKLTETKKLFDMLRLMQTNFNLSKGDKG